MGKLYLACPDCWKVEEASESSWAEAVEEKKGYWQVMEEEMRVLEEALKKAGVLKEGILKEVER